MVSSRFMRNSPRTASPLDFPTKESSTPENESNVQQEQGDSGTDWKEPPLRTPVPSYKDSNGMPHGVLEHMLPLGSMPNQKVRQRVKQYEPARRSALGRPVESVAVPKEPAKAPEVPATRRRSESRKVERRRSKSQTFREKDDDQDYSPKAAVAKPAIAKAASSRNLNAPVPSSQTTAGQERLRLVVVSAVERAKELGNEHLGLAMQRIYEESLHNRTLAELLDAVLSQRPTPRQAADFQAYIKIARKKIKSETSRSRRSSNVGIGSSTKSTSKSPAKSVGPTVAHQQEASTSSAEIDSKTPIRQLPCSPQPDRQMADMNGKHDEPRVKRIKRSRSVSSTSSLSSLSSTDPAIDIDQGLNNPSHPQSSSTSTQSKGQQQVRLSNGPKLHTFATGRAPSARRQSAPAIKPKEEPLPDDELAAKRKHFQMSFHDYKVDDSDLRTDIASKKRDTGLATNPALSALQTSREGRASRRDDIDDARSPVSSTQGDFLVPPPPGAQRPSRGVTPNQVPGRPKKELRKGARIKNSPLKKKSGVVAGIAQKSGGRNSPVGYGDTGEIDNDELCHSCGGSGQLLCCDGCPRSFHFKCLDPPMNPRQPPEGEWYCHVCVSEREPSAKRPRGIFSALMDKIENHNPVAFNLPSEIRSQYESVKTGEDGEYVDTTIQRAKLRDDGVANLELQDKKGNLILCCKCDKSSLGHREIIQCDYCSKRYHLDCLDPPLSNPPPRQFNWKCPAHFDDDLLSFKYPGGDRLIKVRRPKHPRIIDTALRRGHKNNGLIEIDNDPTDDEDEQFPSNVVPRVPERQVKLDFIDRAKRAREQIDAVNRLNGRLSQARKQSSALQQSSSASSLEHNFCLNGSSNLTPVERSIEAVNPHTDVNAIATEKAFQTLASREQDTIISLLNLSNVDPNVGNAQKLGYPNDLAQNVQNLVATLMAQAPVEISSMAGKGRATAVGDASTTKAEPTEHNAHSASDPGKAAVSGEYQQLLMLEELIRHRLESYGAAS